MCSNDGFDEDDMRTHTLFQSLFYYLVSGFVIFVLDESGHPIRMPSGWVYGVGYLSTGVLSVRDKEKDVIYSICNYCPAK